MKNNIRRIRRLLSFSACRAALAVLPLCLALGCAGILGAGRSTLSLVMAMDPFFSIGKDLLAVQEGSRTIGPSSSWLPVRYIVSGEGPGEETFSLESTALNAQARLVPGDWHVEISGFSATGIKVAEGFLDCSLLPNKRVDLTATLYPLQGSGQAEIHVQYSSPVGEGSRIKGSLDFLGLPGQPAGTVPVPVAFDYPSAQADIVLAGVPSGYHKLSLWAEDSGGSRIGGLVDSVLVVKDLVSSGSYTIAIGAPEANFAGFLYPFDPLPSPKLSVRLTAPATHPPRPAAYPTYLPAEGEATQQGWHLFGNYELEARGLADPDILGQGWFTSPYLTDLETAAFATLSFFQSSLLDWRACAGTIGMDLLQGNDASPYGWKASYDYRSASGPSFHAYGSADQGTGSPYQVRALAVSASGVVAASGLDEDGAVHVFGSCGAASVDTVIGPIPIGDHVSWVRLWRDKLKVGGTAKSADRLGLSPDGKWLAAASSASNWLKIYKLGERAAPEASFEFTSASPNLGEMQYIKAIGFSPDSSIIYLASNTSKHLIAFDVSGDAPAFKAKLQLSAAAESITIEDLKVLGDGAVAVTAKGSSQIFLATFVGTDLVLSQTLDKTGVGSALDAPTSVAVSQDGNAFFVLSDDSRILGFVKGQDSLYGLHFSYPLPSPIASAKTLCSFYDPAMGGSEGLFTAGGSCAGFFVLGPEKTIQSFASLAPHPSFDDGIQNSQVSASLEGDIILGGGASGVLSVFGMF